jgi:photosystem II stability/assembly factor-like uncharacterized protein
MQLKMKTKYSLTLLFCIMTSMVTFAQWTVNLSGAPGYYRIDAVHFIDDNTGFVGGTNSLFGGDGIISKTSNGGSSWTTVATITSSPIQAIHFVNSMLGFAVGSNGLMARTTDGGNTWSTQNYTNPNSGNKEVFKSVHFVDQNTGYIAGGFYEMMVLKTIDGGVNWTQLTMPSYFQRLNEVYFTNSNTGYVVGGDQFGGGLGRIYNTTDGGSTWDTLSSGVTNYFNNIIFTDANTGIIGCASNGVILKSTDGGQNWSQISNPAGTSAIGGFTFINSNTGYACTLGGKIIKTTDAGSTWIVDGDVSSTIFSLYSISVPSQNFGIATGLGGVYAEMGGGTDVNYFGNNNSRFLIYPNPSKGNLSIQNVSQNLTNGRIRIIDVRGKEVFSKRLENHTMWNYDLSDLNNGMYIVLIETREYSLTEKLIVDK